ncbi:beta-n-acetylhexosaminidase [Fusarium tjaetaba]|uniref:beta-N-acetylhexosaminidase n=1 Tax=Fusarium tjaetaba TaxID=1567544 RepID=A0A8H5S9P1_9HYPO|nr:beta-n-acetylhexosaminidase [Fusarium tjaetaba]KAF5646702.1 beta-n-acetylhexosaminidase [Fusarium tjaetaba]
MLKEYLVAGILLASPLLAVAQDLIPPILEKADSFVEETWSVDSSPKVIYIDNKFASVSDDDGLTLIPPTAHEFATTFQDDLAKITGSNWTLKRVDSLPNNASGISLGSYTGESSDLTYENGKPTSEGYEIIINSNRVFIGGSGARGMWWGTRTFLQLLLAGNGTITSTLGRDAPAYATRGYMLDAGRKWYSKDFLKELCSYASFFKMNEFHYHLSDNYPLNRGKNESWRDVYSHFSLLPEDESLRGILHGRENETLSRDDFTELQSHCASRGVTVIPEIEAPGHSLYLTKWKPELALAKKDLLNLTHPDTLPTVQSIWKEFLPWFKTKEVHIGADEYDAELADDYITFVNTMSRFINSTANKRSRIWGTHEPSKRNQTIDKTVIIQHWQYGQSDPVQLVKDGYDIINSEDWWAYTSLKNDHMPILPARYPQFFNESRVFNFADKDEWQWTPADFNPVNTSLQLESDEEMLRGATLAVWNDNGPDASTQLEAYYSMRRGIAVVGGRAWSGSRGPKLVEETSDGSVDFYSPRAPDQNLDRPLSLGGNGTLVSWSRSDGDGKEVHLGHGSKGMNYTLTLSITGPFTLSGPDNTLSLDNDENLIFTADGWEYPLRKVTKDDALDLDPGAPGRIWVNTSSTHKPVKVSTPTNITLVTDVLHGTVLFTDGEVFDESCNFADEGWKKDALYPFVTYGSGEVSRGPSDALHEAPYSASWMQWVVVSWTLYGGQSLDYTSMVDSPESDYESLPLDAGDRESVRDAVRAFNLEIERHNISKAYDQPTWPSVADLVKISELLLFYGKVEQLKQEMRFAGRCLSVEFLPGEDWGLEVLVTLGVFDQGDAFMSRIHHNTTKSHPRFAAKLLQFEADTNALSGHPVLHASIRNITYSAMVDGGLLYSLLQYGADPNVIEKWNFRLHLLRTQVDRAAVIVPGLLRHGADPRTRHHDVDVLHYPQVHWLSDLAKQLLNLGLIPVPVMGTAKLLWCISGGGYGKLLWLANMASV